LRRWRETFVDAAARVEALGFDETFRRMWTLYLAYSEAGFRAGYLNVGQFLLRR
jgi:cyclopropane-fatty-acyl-phospholipid synthase